MAAGQEPNQRVGATAQNIGSMTRRTIRGRFYLLFLVLNAYIISTNDLKTRVVTCQRRATLPSRVRVPVSGRLIALYRSNRPLIGALLLKEVAALVITYFVKPLTRFWVFTKSPRLWGFWGAQGHAALTEREQLPHQGDTREGRGG